MPIRWMGAVGITPDWQVLAQIEVEENCDYVDFTGLDINRDWEYYLDVIIKNPTSSDSSYHLYVEGDYTPSNYYNERLHCNGTSVSANRTNDPLIGALLAGERGFITVKITRDPDGYFRYISNVNRETGSNQKLTLRFGSKTAIVTNITQLRVSGAIGAGSRFILARPRS